MIKKKTICKPATLSVKQIILKPKLNKNNTATISKVSSDLFISNKSLKFLNEFYDIPYTYNETTVKVLAQNPTTLFAYWDISAVHRKYVTEKYSSDFFNKTKPVLLVKNEDTKKSFEIDINDFANNWYITVPNTKCKYRVELLRKLRNASNDYIYMASSNLIETPNDHVLIENMPQNVLFYNTKDNTACIKNIGSLKQDGAIVHNIYSLYKDIKKEELLKNPSSSNFIN